MHQRPATKWYRDVAWPLLAVSLIGYMIFMVLMFREVQGVWWM